jgi:hypothetical protein
MTPGLLKNRNALALIDGVLQDGAGGCGFEIMESGEQRAESLKR